MKRTLTAAALTALLISGGSAVAAPHPAHCKVLASATQAQVRDVTGVTAAPTTYGPIHNHVRTVTRHTYSGVQSRTVTTTESRCRGKVSTSTTSTPWTGAKVVTTVTTQRV